MKSLKYRYSEFVLIVADLEVVEDEALEAVLLAEAGAGGVSVADVGHLALALKQIHRSSERQHNCR